MKRLRNIFADKSVEELTEVEKNLLRLVPLAQTAWACGGVSPREKRIIYQAAREDDIDERHEFNDVINEWLLYQPSQAFFDYCLDLISADLQKMTVTARKSLRNNILNRCEKVAVSAGGKSLMDLNHHVSPVEKSLLARLQEILK